MVLTQIAGFLRSWPKHQMLLDICEILLLRVSCLVTLMLTLHAILVFTKQFSSWILVAGLFDVLYSLSDSSFNCALRFFLQ